MSEPAWKLNDDLKTVSISFPTNPPVALNLDTSGVENLLENLGEFRGYMIPEIDKNYQAGQKVKAIIDPHWYVEPELMEGNSLLHIRDPRFGWI